MTTNNKHTLLYIDDEPINLILFATSFNKSFNVLTGNSGTEGLELLNNNSDISIVVTDMKMPEMNGIEFVKKAKDEFQNIIFFILTGFDLTKEISEALNSGLINKYFKKPFDYTEIEASIQEAIKG